jgi:hypothetical protein
MFVRRRSAEQRRRPEQQHRDHSAAPRRWQSLSRSTGSLPRTDGCSRGRWWKLGGKLRLDASVHAPPTARSRRARCV